MVSTFSFCADPMKRDVQTLKRRSEVFYVSNDWSGEECGLSSV